MSAGSLVPIGGDGEAGAHLVCFPHAGGSEMTYAPWRAELADRYRLWTAARRSPGGGAEGGSGWDTLVSAHAAAVSALPGEITLYGHSMGALLAYETARLLRDDGRAVSRLVVSGREAPHIVRRLVVPDDPVELAKTAADLYGGIPDELLDDPDMLHVLGQALMRDYRIFTEYRWRPGEPLDIPLTVFAGADDPVVGEDGAREWKRHTTGPFQAVTIPGGHFPGPEGTAAILATLRESA
nr:alpha/beta fold hydrolase [Nocardiopsis mwathae]